GRPGCGTAVEDRAGGRGRLVAAEAHAWGSRHSPAAVSRRHDGRVPAAGCAWQAPAASARRPGRGAAAGHRSTARDRLLRLVARRFTRSEERRVGKEWG